MVTLSGALAAALLGNAHQAPVLVIAGLCSINADVTGPPRVRAARLAAVMAGGTVGLLLGCPVHASGPGQIAAMAGAGLAAGVLWPRSGTAQLGGLKLMILTCVGFGAGAQLAAPLAVGLYLLGCLPMVLVTTLMWCGESLSRGPRGGLSRRTSRTRTICPPICPPRPARPRARWQLRALSTLHARDALRLATCVGLAATVAVVLHPAHASWLPMTVCLVFRLDPMPLHHRALHRAAGTVVGVLLAVALSRLAPHGWVLLGVAVAVGALVPGITDWSYAGHTSLATVIVLVLTNPAAVADSADIAARLIDTLLACLIALAFGRLIWPRHQPHPFRARRRAHLSMPTSEERM
ncbi:MULTISPECIES: FUSC family protein [unclassified Streptomyces]|uniref:FUSC family protein n=1 Tax=Streptomyces sp. NBC_00060 TaxID=2975636 RepID=A0AAU2GTH4_9ACTN